MAKKEISLGNIFLYDETEYDYSGVNPKEIVLKRGSYTLNIEYPLNEPFMKEMTFYEDVTRECLVKEFVNAYKEAQRPY